MVTRRALIDASGIVTNVIVVSGGGPTGQGGMNFVDLGEFDAVNIGDTWDGTTFTAPAPPSQTPEQIAAALEAAVQRHLDAVAIAAGYDSILSACSYAAAPNPYQHEAVAFLTWRGAVWAHCYQVLTDAQAGNRVVPTEAELIAELPARESA